MQDPPQAIRDYMLALADNRFPAWLLVDREGRVAEAGGPLARYGLDSLQSGQPAEGHAEFLHGMFPLEGASMVLSCVTTETAGTADVHLIPGEAGDYVLLLDASEEVERRRLLQQAMNDLALLREREKAMNDPILEELYSVLGILVLETSRRGAFHVIAPVPEWFTAFAPASKVGAEVDIEAQFPFLEVFLPEAAESWALGTIRRSDVWTEVDPAGNECHLLATALTCRSRSLLLVRRSEIDFLQKQLLLQAARESRLKFDHDATVGKREQDRLAKANRAKSQFLADMGHELRSPLSAILGFSELLQEQSAAAGDSRSVQDLQRIRTAGEHLLSLINEVLDLSKAEAGMMRLNIDEFTVRKLVQDVLNLATPLIAKNGNTVHLDCPDDPGVMRSDMIKIRQSVLNLISNAAKFTRKGSITVSIVRRSLSGSDWIDIAVRDTGIGMTPTQMARLFKPFVQADPSIQRDFGGTGLGLAISREYCHLMGGDISVESTPGAGSKFTIHLPARIAGGDASS